jgi:N-acetylmuramoyl-L-alanine amidase
MTRLRVAVSVLATAALLCGARSTSAQEEAVRLTVERAEGGQQLVDLAIDRGFATVPLSLMEELGWSVAEVGQAIALLGPDGLNVSFTYASPFFVWDGAVLQLVDPPYRVEGETRVPLQFLSDFVALRLPELYAFDGPSLTLRAADPADWAGGQISEEVRAALDTRRAVADSAVGRTETQPGGAQPTRMPDVVVPTDVADGPRVVIIDAGHGGGDPGTLGLRGIREKDVALGIAKIMADLLRREEGIEVYMTRDTDVFVPIWERGELATAWKGDRPGVFVSIHANSTPDRRSARGFETYYLSEARTEHERRVEAIENAPLQVQGQSIDPDSEPDLGFILRELRSLDHQHWSSLLAEMVQQETSRFHPGPDRGVKEGVLAVLTNALMPSVLVEVGFLSNEDEGPLLVQPTFQDETARAISRAVLRFFARYPPGSGTGREQP